MRHSRDSNIDVTSLDFQFRLPVVRLLIYRNLLMNIDDDAQVRLCQIGNRILQLIRLIGWITQRSKLNLSIFITSPNGKCISFKKKKIVKLPNTV